MIPKQLSIAVSVVVALGAVTAAPVRAQPNEPSRQVQVTSGITPRPVEKKGETFFDETFFVRVVANVLLLSNRSDGTGAFTVDDLMVVTVTRPDGEQEVLSHDFSNDCTKLAKTGPFDLSSMAAPGVNQVRVQMRDVCGVKVGSTGIWLNDIDPQDCGTFVAGTDDSDVLSGTASRENFVGLGGDDQIDGGDGGDCVRGDGGDDLIGGGIGDDLLDGGADVDTVSGGTGADQIFGGPHRDLLLGDEDDDVISDIGGINEIYGGDGNDLIFARQKLSDAIDCGLGTDQVFADPNDELSGCEEVNISWDEEDDARRAVASTSAKPRKRGHFRTRRTIDRASARAMALDHVSAARRPAALCGEIVLGKYAVVRWAAKIRFRTPHGLVATIGWWAGRGIGRLISGATGPCGAARQHLNAANQWRILARDAYRPGKPHPPFRWRLKFTRKKRWGPLPDLCVWEEWAGPSGHFRSHFRVTYYSGGRACP